RWRILSEGTGIWRDILLARYETLFPAPHIGGRPNGLRGASWWWSDVSLLGTPVESQSDWFSEGVFKRIGNGILTSFWFDPWVDSVPLRIRYQSLFQASDQCLDIVADMGNWVRGEWVWEFRWRTNLGMHDQDLLTQLIDSLHQDRVPTRQILRKRRVLVGTTDTSCVFCGAVEESVDHLFVSCERVSPIWYRITRWLGIEYVCLNRIMQVFESFFGISVGHRVRLGMVLIWHAVVRSIWTSRNDIIFAGGSSTFDNLVDK
ncbi:cytochrome P450, partial [Trifolium medium]|nr:cytochrome P450 [Trifolium medium]